ncbi:hypothetical protein KEM56_001586 [Ascosphaera pollenicola]|nr:hypothetical protein KEM56_001586 [Ascosphaera pollenicola]
MESTKPEKATSSVLAEAVGYSEAWSPGFWKRFPWTGMVSLLFVFLCLVFNIIILVVSNGMRVDKWGVQPAVLIAISTAISNGLLRIAFVQGGMITWWRNAMSGCSVTHLSSLWTMYNENPFLLFKKFHVVGLAMIAVVVAPIDSPLYQRAQTVETRIDTSHENLQVKIAQQLPLGYTGNLQARPIPTLTSITDKFRTAYLAYSNREPMYLETPGHDNANFSATVNAAGFKVQCKQHAVQTNFGWTYSLGNGNYATMDNVSHSKTVGVHGPDVDVFQTELAWSASKPAMLNLTASWKPNGPCVGQLQVKECTFETATLKYGIEVQGGQVTFRDSLDTLGMDDDTIVDTYNYTRTELDTNSTLGGFYMVGKDLFTSVGKISQGGSVRALVINTNGTLVQQTAINLANVTTQVGGTEACNVTFQDPTYLIVSGFQELMFRTSLTAANDSSTTLYKDEKSTPVDLRQTPRATLQESQAIFRLHPGFLGGAAAVSFVCAVLVLSTLYGWWTLGQKVTMNPIAVSRAFGSPLLEGEGINEATEKAKVKYGPDVVATGSDQSGQSGEEAGPLMRSQSIRPRFTFCEE